MPCATCKPTEVARRAANVSSLNPPGQPEAATEATTTPATERPGPQVVADLVAAGQLTHAIAAASAALADPALDADERVALLALRFDSHFLRMELAQAGANVQAMKALARRPASPARQAQALICESQLQRRLGNAQASLVAARAALKAAAAQQPAGARSAQPGGPWQRNRWQATTCPRRWPTCSRPQPASRPWAT